MTVLEISPIYPSMYQSIYLFMLSMHLFMYTSTHTHLSDDILTSEGLTSSMKPTHMATLLVPAD